MEEVHQFFHSIKQYLKVILPDLNNYRTSFLEKGITFPLVVTPVNKEGLLNSLPKADKSKTGWPWTEQVEPSVYKGKVSWPKLTIVTPSYNQGNFLEETIRSVLLQNYPNLEYILIDGKSSDHSLEIIKKYSPWLSFWKSEKDTGQANAINQGFSLADGAYLGWINSDDYYLKNTFNKVITKFIETSSSFIYGYALDYHYETKRFLDKKKVLPFLDFFIRMPSLAQPSCFWSAKIHQPLWEELFCALDYELWIRIVKGVKRSLIKEPLSVANVHIEAKTHDPNMKHKWQHDHELICSTNAHGPVNNWDYIIFINRIRVKLYKWLRLN